MLLRKNLSIITNFNPNVFLKESLFSGMFFFSSTDIVKCLCFKQMSYNNFYEHILYAVRFSFTDNFELLVFLQAGFCKN